MNLKLASIGGLATTTGNLLVASSSNTGWTTLAVAGNGLCLQASSSQPTGLIWSPCISISGSQANYLSIWTSSTTQGTSTIYQSGTFIGIGTSTPTTTLTVYGTSTFIGGYVGIGTTIPGAKLDVNGSLRVEGGSNPVLKGNWDPNDANVMDGTLSVYVSGKYAYVAGGDSDNLAIVDISNPASPTTVGNWDPNVANVMDGAFSVYVSGKYAYVAGYTSDNLAIVDISNSASPTTVGNWDPNDANVMDLARSVYVSGKYAYVAGYTSDNLAIVDISNPASPTTVGNWDPNVANVMEDAFSVYVSGKYAYVAGYTSDNLAIVDISNPASPTTVGNWDPNVANVMDTANSVYVSGKYAYVAGYTSDNLAIVDISNPASPTTVGNWDPNVANVMDGANSVYVSGKYAYVTGENSSNTAIVDISNPASPTTVGNWDPNDANIMNGAVSVYVSGKYAYVAGYLSDNLAIVDIGGIETPNLFAGSLNSDTFMVNNNAIINNNLYVQNGLNVGPGGLYVDSGEVAFDGNSSAAAFTFGQRGFGDILNVFDNTTEVFTILDGGNVGIGTSTPASTLQVYGTSTFMGGNVGIGTTNLVSLLTVAGNIFPSTTTTYTLGSSAYKWANIYAATATIGSAITINSTDISSSAGLNITGASTSTWKTSLGNLTIQSAGNLNASSSDNLIFTTAGTEIMRIASTTGYIGIRTINPNDTLEVNGSITATGLQDTGKTTKIFLSASTTNKELDYMEYSSDALAGSAYISNSDFASGGTVTHSGGYTIHTFTASETFSCVGTTTTVEYLVVGGGGSGFGHWVSGGGGAGGYASGTLAVSGTIAVTVGVGGVSGSISSQTGSSSVFSTITALGGGGGGIYEGVAASGGSGGGAGGNGGGTPGQSTQFSTYGYGVGNAGGYSALTNQAGGGGGAGSAGYNSGIYGVGGNGGTGLPNSITGSIVIYAAGGGGSGWAGAGGGTGGSSSIGGNGSHGIAPAAKPNGNANTGSGGGAGYYIDEVCYAGGNGGSGIVVVKYPTSPRLQSYSTSSTKTQGSYSLKVIANKTDSLNKTLTRTIGTLIDLTERDEIKFDIYSSRTGSNIKVGIHDSGGTTSETTPNVTATGTWQTVTWDISGVSNANKNVIDQIIITIVNADATNTFYIDNMYASVNTSPDIVFATLGSERMRINSSGNIGIGTTDPETRLQVTGGGLCVGSDANCNTDNNTEGTVYAAQTAMTVYDVAENYPTKDSALEAAEVVTLDKDNPVFVKRSSSAYDSKLLGVVSTEPGVLLGGFKTSKSQFLGETQVPIALSGRVPVKVSLENGPINVGDPLTSASSTPGAAMKATRAGRIIGIALESFDGTTIQCHTDIIETAGGATTTSEDCQLQSEIGKVMVFINPHWRENDLSFEQDSSGQIVNVYFQQGLADLGLMVNEHGVLEVEKLKAKIVEVSSGITILDQDTNQPYCVYIKNGQMQTTAGECLNKSSTSTMESAPIASSTEPSNSPVVESPPTEPSTPTPPVTESAPTASSSESSTSPVVESLPSEPSTSTSPITESTSTEAIEPTAVIETSTTTTEIVSPEPVTGTSTIGETILPPEPQASLTE